MLTQLKMRMYIIFRNVNIAYEEADLRLHIIVADMWRRFLCDGFTQEKMHHVNCNECIVD